MSYLSNPLFGVFLSLAVFMIGQWLFKKSNGFFLFQPLFVAMVLGIAILVVLGKSFDVSTAQVYAKTYKPGGDIIFWFLTPATIAFAVPLYKRNDVVKKNWGIILSSLVIGTIVSLFAITIVAKSFGLDKIGVASMLSQSATTAIALPLTSAIGGNASVTAMACILNAVIIYALGNKLVKWFKLKEDPVGAGLGLGTAGHTIGSAFALEMGSAEGAMAAVAVVVIGLVDNLVVPVFAHLMGI
ncbi:antiholin-like protein LrgB [Ligilactobacillus acidipiscis]|uniref:Antiholin-like protein LrgB n=1 Tax=Ligilactobacillus acidipiscis TaxID=89059 RepID=A0A921F8P5_9LACO|nr:antiholin-like protein LrgB [Ligilactobacillus acidipiscis]WEV57105.1 antiholin-like protein LrgB [Ligilactobacillus acidipiscis]HJE96207.1 antiholin-like protein LrgB [Ligilactobacillus acidipiscis]